MLPHFVEGSSPSHAPVNNRPAVVISIYVAVVFSVMDGIDAGLVQLQKARLTAVVEDYSVQALLRDVET